MPDDHDTLILSRLRDPWKFLMLDADIGMLAVCVGIAMLSMDMHIFVVVGAPIAVGYGMHKLRQDKPKGFGAHLRYWYFPPLMSQLKRTPDSHCHRTLG
jgi:type IV conjugative transfer system protein TraL